MSRFCILFTFAAAMFFAVGCETTDKPKEPKTQKVEQRKLTKEEKKRKAMRDPVSDMLKIERKESKPFLADSEELSSKEKQAFSESWSNQHKEAEEIHRKVRGRHEREKDKKDSWVFF